MVVVDPAAGTSEDTNAASQMDVEELAPLLKERGRSTDAPADGASDHQKAEKQATQDARHSRTKTFAGENQG